MHISKKSKRLDRWKELTESELYLYLGVIMMMEIIKVPEYKMHWSNDTLIKTGISDLISLNRFELISRCIIWEKVLSDKKKLKHKSK